MSGWDEVVVVRVGEKVNLFVFFVVLICFEVLIIFLIFYFYVGVGGDFYDYVNVIGCVCRVGVWVGWSGFWLIIIYKDC